MLFLIESSNAATWTMHLLAVRCLSDVGNSRHLNGGFLLSLHWRQWESELQETHELDLHKKKLLVFIGSIVQNTI